MTDTADARIDAYIAALPEWQQTICREVRGLVHAADPQVTETIKRTRYPYFVLQGNICALQAAKDHVNIFLYDGAIVPDPEGIITAGHDNKTAHRGRPPGTNDQRSCFDCHVQANHCEQSRRRLAQVEKRALAPCSSAGTSPVPRSRWRQRDQRAGSSALRRSPSP